MWRGWARLDKAGVARQGMTRLGLARQGMGFFIFQLHFGPRRSSVIMADVSVKERSGSYRCFMNESRPRQLLNRGTAPVMLLAWSFSFGINRPAFLQAVFVGFAEPVPRRTEHKERQLEQLSDDHRNGRPNELTCNTQRATGTTRLAASIAPPHASRINALSWTAVEQLEANLKIVWQSKTPENYLECVGDSGDGPHCTTRLAASRIARVSNVKATCRSGIHPMRLCRTGLTRVRRLVCRCAIQPKSGLRPNMTTRCPISAGNRLSSVLNSQGVELSSRLIVRSSLSRTTCFQFPFPVR